MSVVALYPCEASLNNITGVHANKHPMTKQIWKFFPLKQTSCDFFLSVVTNFQYPISIPSGHLSFHAMHDSGYCSCRVSMKSLFHSHLYTLRQCFYPQLLHLTVQEADQSMTLTVLRAVDSKQATGLSL